MNIYRPVQGVYHCSNHKGDEQRYILIERAGCYPTLVPLLQGAADTAHNEMDFHKKAVPIVDFSK